MWLINTTTLKLEYFIGPEAASGYAILSHTWGDGEVTFQEFQDLDSAKLKPGFAKIQKTCHLAREKDGLQHAWVDTCCIDKSSSAELSESINSMYDWYQGSTICYAYLNDWESDSDGDWTKLGELEPTAPETKPLRWFTRGWTLQELIAPAKITFYDRSWVARGTKSDEKVIRELSRITGITSCILQDGSEENLRETSLGQRMSWASYRRTTRTEDTAYCLLGIFQVNMPLLYGEGGRAFIRLQEEIIKTSTDFSLFAWSHSIRWGDQMEGILSSHPYHFRRLRDCALAPSLFSAQDGEEAVMTNKGLRVHTFSLFGVEQGSQIPRHWVSEHHYLSLGCTTGGQHAYISLRKISPNVYLREYPESISGFENGMIGQRLEPQSIYIVTRYSQTYKGLAGGPFAKISGDESGFQLRFDLVNTGCQFQFVNMWPQNLFRYADSAYFDFTVSSQQFARFVGYLELSICSSSTTTPGLRFPNLIVAAYKLQPQEPVCMHVLCHGDAKPLLSLKDSIQGLNPTQAEEILFGQFNPTVLPGKIDLDDIKPTDKVLIKDETRRKVVVVEPVRFLPDERRCISLYLRDS